MGRKKDISQRPCARLALALLAYPHNSSSVDQALAESIHGHDAQRLSLEQARHLARLWLLTVLRLPGRTSHLRARQD